MAKLFCQKFVIFSMITDSCLVEKWGILERARRCVCKGLLNLDFQDSILKACLSAYPFFDRSRKLSFLGPI